MQNLLMIILKQLLYLKEKVLLKFNAREIMKLFNGSMISPKKSCLKWIQEAALAVFDKLDVLIKQFYISIV